MTKTATPSDMKVLLRNSGDYPESLLQLPSPPERLYYRGDISLIHKVHAVAVIGTRNATPYGLTVARQLGKFLAEQGVTVVSGLARGIDGAAHAGCLQISSGQPLAVVGCGLDLTYPPEHQRLQERVAERGLVLSEYPPGSPPMAFHFPQRNRIVAALSRVLVVVEAPARSGALLSVTQALELGREVMVVPGPMNSPTCIGNLRLLRDGSAPVVEFEDIIQTLLGYGGGQRTAPPDLEGEPDVQGDRGHLMPFGLGPAGATLEELCLGLRRPPEELLPELLRAELEGKIRRTLSRYYPCEG